MSQAQGYTEETAFDGRIQLNGDAAPELEVIVTLDDQFLVLGHSSGELGRWEKANVHVASIGRGWFSLDVEEEQVTFLPRRPGHFAAATVDLVPVEEIKKKRFQRKPRAKAEAPKTSRKERRLQRQTAAEAAAGLVQPATESAPPAIDPATPAPQPEPAPHLIEPAPTPVEPPPASVEPQAVWVEPAPAPAPETRPPRPPREPSDEPASPWDDVTVPEVPGPKPRRQKRPPRTPDALPKAPPKKPAKARREKTPKRSAKPDEPAAGTWVVEPVGPPKKGAFSRGLAGFRHGLKGFAYRISDELRQTGIVPFDRLPAAPGRRPDEDHEHVFEEHRLPGGLVRNVCHSCGRVSIGESNEND